MKRRYRIWVVLALLAGCAGDERDPEQWPLSKRELEAKSVPAPAGEATYRRYCTACHGVDGRANGGVTGADFVSQTTLLSAKSDAELAASVREGKRGERGVMPAHKPVLSDAQINDVILYVRKRFFQDGSAAR